MFLAPQANPEQSDPYAFLKQRRVAGCPRARLRLNASLWRAPRREAQREPAREAGRSNQGKHRVLGEEHKVQRSVSPQWRRESRGPAEATAVQGPAVLQIALIAAPSC